MIPRIFEERDRHQNQYRLGVDTEIGTKCMRDRTVSREDENRRLCFCARYVCFSAASNMICTLSTAEEASGRSGGLSLPYKQGCVIIMGCAVSR